MTPEEFVARLESISQDNGERFGRLKALAEGQEAHAILAGGYKGFHALAAAWRCFFLETIEKLNSDVRPNVTTQLSEFYPLFVERLAQYFQALRGAELVATRGYPLQA
jgi:hypothetical protein